MPSALTYPGVYVEEIPSGVRTIVGVSTSTTAFVDRFKRGPMKTAYRITSYAEFERVFGGLDRDSEASYGIRQYYLNGGSVAYVVRVAGGTPTKASLTLQGGSPLQNTLTIQAASEGEWANTTVQVAVVQAPGGRFNLFVREVAVQGGNVVQEAGQPKVLATESFRNLTMDKASPDYAVNVLKESTLIEGVDHGLGEVPTGSAGTPTGEPANATAWQAPTGGSLSGGSDGSALASSADLLGTQADRSGIYALDGIAPNIFNILCLPAAAELDDTNLKAVYDDALTYCIQKRAFVIVDIPETVDRPEEAVTQLGKITTHNHAAIYFPRLQVPDPLNGGRLRNVAASGTLAGIYARTDAARGVWKAPAGTDATLFGADLATVLTDGQNGGLNPLGINVLRNFPVFGNIAWGARTLDGADQKASEWKYIPVRRTALFIEESLFQALKWVVFEPNDEPLWSQIRLNVGAFMNDLFRQGAFQGRTPREAYFVKCDKDTTTQNDINRGVVNVVVGFAPLKPAEFVVIRIQQMAGQVQV
jgi:uncharacterized protein